MSGFRLPAAMLCVRVSGSADAVVSVAAVNGPLPVPLDVPVASVAPPEVALMLKVN